MKTIDLPRPLPLRELHQRRAHIYAVKRAAALYAHDLVNRIPLTAVYLAKREYLRGVEFRADSRYARLPLLARVLTWKP